ncbi:hypothetical protein [Robinsoniella sp. KNHs210]|uniref:hypothetical protein n=1 Tax=Robinsoniella sp. KNHs210 TaxID=1469950 RepID=UPI000484A15F|nr:hypothetical protein [Robinsoniella sp. KNHs210]
MTAEKGNKVYLIDEKEKISYQTRGFDIKDDSGNIIASGKGKTVSYEEYMKAVTELEALKKAKGKKPGQEKEGE